MKYSVVILPTAENDLNRILLWLNERSQVGALTWLKRWDEVVLTLAHDPDRCGIAPESDRFADGQLIVVEDVCYRGALISWIRDRDGNRGRGTDVACTICRGGGKAQFAKRIDTSAEHASFDLPLDRAIGKQRQGTVDRVGCAEIGTSRQRQRSRSDCDVIEHVNLDTDRFTDPHGASIGNDLHRGRDAIGCHGQVVWLFYGCRATVGHSDADRIRACGGIGRNPFDSAICIDRHTARRID